MVMIADLHEVVAHQLEELEDESTAVVLVERFGSEDGLVVVPVAIRQATQLAELRGVSLAGPADQEQVGRRRRVVVLVGRCILAA